MSLSASVLINNHNYGRFIAEAITSALHQTCRPLEVIVVDDGSTDVSAAIVSGVFSSHPAVRFVTKSNAGQLSAFAAGLERARGDVVFFLDADDRYEPFHVEQCLDVLRQHRGVDFAFTAHRQFGASDRVCHLAPPGSPPGFLRGTNVVSGRLDRLDNVDPGPPLPVGARLASRLAGPRAAGRCRLHLWRHFRRQPAGA